MTGGEPMPDPTAASDRAPRASAVSLPSEFVRAERITHRLRRALQRAGAIFNEQVGDGQLTPTQWAVLVTLHEHGSLSQVRLGRLTFVDPATTQGVVMRLIERRLVERRTDPRDRRRKTVWLTEAGTALVTDLLPRAADAHGRFLEPLSEEEQARFLELLERLS